METVAVGYWARKRAGRVAGDGRDRRAGTRFQLPLLRVPSCSRSCGVMIVVLETPAVEYSVLRWRRTLRWRARARAQGGSGGGEPPPIATVAKITRDALASAPDPCDTGARRGEPNVSFVTRKACETKPPASTRDGGSPRERRRATRRRTWPPTMPFATQCDWKNQRSGCARHCGSSAGNAERAAASACKCLDSPPAPRKRRRLVSPTPARWTCAVARRWGAPPPHLRTRPEFPLARGRARPRCPALPRKSLAS